MSDSKHSICSYLLPKSASVQIHGIWGRGCFILFFDKKYKEKKSRKNDNWIVANISPDTLMQCRTHTQATQINIKQLGHGQSYHFILAT